MSLKSLSGKSILVVEDEYHIATEMASHLLSAGINVVGPASNADNALALISERPDLAGAILDIRLGDTNVFPVADELKRLSVPYVFATALEPDQIPARHADKIVLRKPVEDEAIVAALTQVIQEGSVSIEQASRNALLARLQQRSLGLILPKLQTITLPRGAVMEIPNQIVNRVYFPIDCVGSLIVVGRDGSMIETGLVGREGMTGTGLADGDDRTPFELITQIDGEALVMNAADFVTTSAIIPELRVLSGRFARSLGVQVSFTALTNARFDIKQRLARWLIMVHDRVPGRDFHLTHDYLAIMLGVRRPSVTDALHLLEGEKLIRSTRSNVEIRDRQGLVDVAGEAYGTPEAEYERLITLPLALGSEPVSAIRVAAMN
jgi:CheY-like chemotaxis protein/CRP-like cAMP-binding protein